MKRSLSYFGVAIAILIGCSTSEIERACISSPSTPYPAEVDPIDINPVEANPDESSEVFNQQDTHGISRRMRRVADMSRDASVEVHNLERGVRGTGTYFSFEDHLIVITAAHVVDGSSDIVEVRTPSGQRMPAYILYFDNRVPNDMAVLILKDTLESRKAMPLKLRTNTSKLVGDEVVYTGNPGHHRQMTIFGNVSGFETDGSIILHSYTWGGASGSAVFDYRGRLVGILKAVDLNRTRFSPFPQITEDIVWLAPASGINSDGIKILLQIYDLVEALHLGETP